VRSRRLSTRLGWEQCHRIDVFTALHENAYGNLYSEPTDIFATPYANDIAGLLPSTTPISTIYSEGLLPNNTLFSSTPPASQYASITPATTPSDLASCLR
jgi:hypothetical protein